MTIVNMLGKKITVECTYLKTMLSVKNLAKTVNLEKETMNYLQNRTKNHQFNQEEKKYIKVDVVSVENYIKDVEQKYLLRFKKKLKWKITISATAINELKTHFKNDDWNTMFKKSLNSEESKYLRHLYNGGLTNYNIKHVGETHKNISSLDIVSSYPAIWQQCQLPYGPPIYHCPCNNDDLLNTSEHFKVYEIKLLKDIKIIPGKENMIPTKQEAIIDNKRITSIEYFPFMFKKDFPDINENVWNKHDGYYMSQYMLQIFLTLFQPNKNDIIIKKTMCFNQKIIVELKEYNDLWEQEKNNTNKETNAAYYHFCKLMLNSPTGKFGQLEILDETIFTIDENRQLHRKINKNVRQLEDLTSFSYLPVIIATTDMARLKLLSLIETVGWDLWHNSDTDSCKFWLPPEFRPEQRPLYYNLITGKKESIYNDDPKHKIFGKWELEWTAPNFKCCGKKKYIYQRCIKCKGLKIDCHHKLTTEVVCAGAPDDIKKQMNFKNFFVGFQSIGDDKNSIIRLNGLPVVLATTFEIKDIFYSKNLILRSFRHLLHPYYAIKVDTLFEKAKANKKQKSKFKPGTKVIISDLKGDIVLESEKGTYD